MVPVPDTLSSDPAGGRLDFEEFYAASWAGLLRTAYAIAGDPHLAEDAAQTAFAHAYAAWWRVARADNPKAYVRRIAVNAALEQARRPASRRERPMAAPYDRPTRDGLDELGEHDEMWRAVQALPPRQRAVVVLRFYEDLSEREIAAVLGVRTGTVKSQCSAALSTLRGRLTADITEKRTQ